MHVHPHACLVHEQGWKRENFSEQPLVAFILLFHSIPSTTLRHYLKYSEYLDFIQILIPNVNYNTDHFFIVYLHQIWTTVEGPGQDSCWLLFQMMGKMTESHKQFYMQSDCTATRYNFPCVMIVWKWCAIWYFSDAKVWPWKVSWSCTTDKVHEIQTPNSRVSS